MLYHSYQHVERYTKEGYESFAEAKDVFVFPKLDGTAGVVTFEDGNVRAGSRNRAISVESDNQGFAAWVLMSDDPEAVSLREFCKENPNLHVHGEWLGAHKLLGSIKDYLKNGFWVYDVYDESTDLYLPYDVYGPLLDECGVKNVISPMAVLESFDEEKIVELAKSNHFLLPEGKVGEGVVMKSYGFRDIYGKQQFFKLVLEEFKANKGKGKPKFEVGEIEAAIVEDFVTAADIDKAFNKSKLALGEDAKLNKVVGMTMNLAMEDLISEEFVEVVKKYRYPKVDFGTLKALVCAKVRAQLIK